MREFVIYDRKLSASERLQNEEYFRDEYEIVSLGWQPPIMESEWTRRKLIPMAGIAAWHSLEDATTDEIPDYTGNNRTLTCATNNPVLQTDVINGLPAMYFDGTNDPFGHTAPSSFTIKHVFILASFEDATFPATFGGLLTDKATTTILTGNPSTAKFYDTDYELSGDFIYRIADVQHAENDQVAPVSGTFKLMEVSFDVGWTMDGIQIGRDRDNATRLWKGWFAESLLYDRVLDDIARLEIYQYFALKYHLWQETAAGLSVFPFVANKPRSVRRGQEHYLSEPYLGDPKALIRGNKIKQIVPQYLLRSQLEFEAAEDFHGQHYPDPSNHFVFRDYNFYPSKDVECRFLTEIEEQGSDVSFRFNYGFTAIEVG